MNVSELLPLRRRRRGMSTSQKAVLGGALALVAAPALKIVASNLFRRFAGTERPPKATSEAAIDKTLKDTFPASDPPASHYFDIPANRQ